MQFYIMNKHFLIRLFTFICAFSFSQIEEFKLTYLPLVSSGTLPDIYTRSASEKTNADLATLNKTKVVSNRSAQEKFYLNSNFSQDRLLRSGKILFNDPVSKYVNKVADEVFKTNP